MKKYIIIFIQLIIGFLFLVSGFVKLIDPIGFSYKLDEYFSSSVLNLPFLLPFSLTFSITFAVLEAMLGVALLLGVWKKLIVNLLFLLTLFFGFLTFYSAYFNKVTDCGCFGEFIKISPWNSFFKNFVLLLLIIVVRFNLNHIRKRFSSKVNYATLIAFLVLFVVITYRGIRHEPIIDFRPYAVGKNLKEAMTDGYPGIEESIFILLNKNTNKEQAFSSKEYIDTDLWKDTLNWKYVRMSTKVLRVAKLPSVHDFYIQKNGNDITKQVLELQKVVLFIVPYSEKLSVKNATKLQEYYFPLIRNGVTTLVLSNSEKIVNNLQSFILDPTTLKTISRAELSLIILKHAVVKAKYHANDFPPIENIITF